MVTRPGLQARHAACQNFFLKARKYRAKMRKKIVKGLDIHLEMAYNFNILKENDYELQTYQFFWRQKFWAS